MEKTPDGNNSDIVILTGEFIESIRVLKYSTKSISTYVQSLKEFKSFLQTLGKSSVVEITADDLTAYRLTLVERELKQNSIYLYMRVVRLFFAYLHKHEHIFVNPADAMDQVGADHSLQPVPTEEEVRMLLSAPDTSTVAGVRDRALLETFYSTAARLGEMVGMDLGCVRFDDATMRIMGKGSRERILPVGRDALEWMRKYLEVREGLRGNRSGENAFWLNFYGGRLSGLLQERLIRMYAESNPGISTHITAHSLRRACATHMLRRGASPVEIQMLLGHASMLHLKYYLRVSIFDLKAVHAGTKVGE
jgi:integrase/recombinase XerD